MLCGRADNEQERPNNLCDNDSSGFSSDQMIISKFWRNSPKFSTVDASQHPRLLEAATPSLLESYLREPDEFIVLESSAKECWWLGNLIAAIS